MSGTKRLVNFGYTFCPDVCPTSLAEIATVTDKLHRQNIKLKPIFVTIDPYRDTTEILNEYLLHFHNRLIGLRATGDSLVKLTESFKAVYGKSEVSATDP